MLFNRDPSPQKKTNTPKKNPLKNQKKTPQNNNNKGINDNDHFLSQKVFALSRNLLKEHVRTLCI